MIDTILKKWWGRLYTSVFLNNIMFLLEEKKNIPRLLLFLSFHGLLNEEYNQILIGLRCYLRISSPTPQAWASWSWGLYRKAVTIFTCLSNWEHCLAAHSGLLDKCVQYSLISWWDTGQSILRMWTEWNRNSRPLCRKFCLILRSTMNEQRFCSTGYAVASFLQ